MRTGKASCRGYVRPGRGLVCLIDGPLRPGVPIFAAALPASSHAAPLAGQHQHGLVARWRSTRATYQNPASLDITVTVDVALCREYSGSPKRTRRVPDTNLGPRFSIRGSGQR
ncbi:hypothetical protein E1288_34910 [Saccharopolyspora elongata]|uniref:Uncharacterized protein n=1 Tax=Saccharopolyspora elongata TaxID=2530387 RepID=A0A4R4Y8I7_9PSEU|nr:hypothetical protein E1288_34910 [Saccharopolyspora elongata]